MKYGRPVEAEQEIATPDTKWSAAEWWLAALLLSVFFLPPLRLGALIPFRLDDLVAFGGCAWIICIRLMKARVPRLDAVGAALLVTAAAIAGSSYAIGASSQLSVGVKEYLDVLRPLKFLAVYIVVRRMPRAEATRTLERLLSYSVPALVLFALIQFFFINPDSSGPLASLSLLFTELPPELARPYFGMRAFATFHTPTDLGYVGSIALMGSFVLTSMPHRVRTGVLSATAILLSGTRTFTFGIPLILLGLSVIGRGTLGDKLRRLALSVGCVIATAILLLALIPKLSPDFAANTTRSFAALTTGSFDQDQSISTRLQNFELVTYTWNHARYFGVISRDMLTVAADSEYILTFHRYGLVGILELLAFYAAAFQVIRKTREMNPAMSRFALLTLLLTSLYGLTQGALINTRIGVFPIAIIGIVSSGLRSTKIRFNNAQFKMRFQLFIPVTR